MVGLVVSFKPNISIATGHALCLAWILHINKIGTSASIANQ